MLVTLFEVGSLGFWLLCACWFASSLAFIAYEKPGWATLVAVAFFGLLATCGDFNIVAVARSRPDVAMWALLAYLVAGVVTSAAKLWLYMRDLRDIYREYKEKFLQQNGANVDVKAPMPEELRGKWKEYARDHGDDVKRGGTYYDISRIPTASQYKTKIMMWMALWPLVVFWTLVNDFVRKVWKRVYDLCQGMYEEIVKSVFKGVEEDFKVPPAPAAPDPAPEQYSRRSGHTAGNSDY